MIWATWLVQLWVGDWGFGQYFLNIKDGVFVKEAERGFKELGATDIGNIFSSVADYYEENMDKITSSKSEEEYNEIMGIAALEAKFGDILDTFYSQKKRFYQLRAEYIRKHESIFRELERNGTD